MNPGKNWARKLVIIIAVCMLWSILPTTASASETGTLHVQVLLKYWHDTLVPPQYDYKTCEGAVVALTNCDDPSITYRLEITGTYKEDRLIENIIPGYYDIEISCSGYDTYIYRNALPCGMYLYVTMNEYQQPILKYDAHIDSNLGTPAGGVIHLTHGDDPQGYDYSYVPGDTVSIDIHPYRGKQLKPGSLKYNNGTIYKAKTQEWEMLPSGLSDGSTASLTMPAYNITITAEFETIPVTPATYRVSFDGQVNDVQNLPDPITNLAAYSKIDEPILEPSREGYSFFGWYKEWECQNLWDFSTDVISGDTILWAKWLAGFKVIFRDWDGGKIAETAVTEGAAATAPPEPDTWEGHHFVKWNQDFSNVSSDLWVTAEYEINKYTVTFKDWDGSVLKLQEDVEYGSAASAPALPSRPGYRCSGWDAQFNNVVADLVVNAVYVPTHTVAFDSQGGSSVEDQIVNHGGKAQLSDPEPTRTDYYLGGWYKEPECVNIWDFTADTVDRDITLWAKWLTNTDTSGMTEFKAASPVVASTKKWTIKLSGIVDEDTIDSGIYVVNSQGNPQTITRKATSVEGCSHIEVAPPSGGYADGNYTLFVNGIKSSGGAQLKNRVYLNFTV